jgi:hypothetical protein
MWRNWLIRMLAIVFVTLFLVAVSTVIFQDYGWTLMVGLPAVFGMACGLFAPVNVRWPVLAVGFSFLLPLIALFAGLILTGLEGLLCLAMVAPIYVGVALVGLLFGSLIRKVITSDNSQNRIAMVLFLLLPVMMGFEHMVMPRPPLRQVRTSIYIDASPQRVWDTVIHLPRMPDPDEWLFRMGVAYPTHAEIKEVDGQLTRFCHFSTGPVIELITLWDEPCCLRFDVTEQPEALEEFSLYDIHPPHLRHYFATEKGEFLLTPEAGGTRMQGTTWYRVNLWPEFYWKRWCDYLVGKIHHRVLGHIKVRSETEEDNAAGQ